MCINTIKDFCILTFINLKICQKNLLVVGLPRINIKQDIKCDTCLKNKMVFISHKSKNVISTKRPLELLHMDLFGPTRVLSLEGSKYGLVIVDDFSRYAWMLFLRNKYDTFDAFQNFTKQIQNEKGYSIVSLRTDHGKQLDNSQFISFLW